MSGLTKIFNEIPTLKEYTFLNLPRYVSYDKLEKQFSIQSDSDVLNGRKDLKSARAKRLESKNNFSSYWDTLAKLTAAYSRSSIFVSETLEVISCNYHVEAPFNDTTFSIFEMENLLTWFTLHQEKYSKGTLLTALFYMKNRLKNSPADDKWEQIRSYVSLLLANIIRTSQDETFYNIFKIIEGFLSKEQLFRLVEVSGEVGNKEIFKLILTRCRYIFEKCMSDKDPNAPSTFFSAIREGHLPILYPMIRSSLGNDVTAGYLRARFLKKSAEIGEIKNVEYLLEVMPKNEKRIETLNNLECVHIATRGGHIELVKYLATCGAQLDKEDTNKKKPIDYALQNGDIALIKFLSQGKIRSSRRLFDQTKPVQSVFQLLQPHSSSSVDLEKLNDDLEKHIKDHFLTFGEKELSSMDRAFILRRFLFSEEWKSLQPSIGRSYEHFLSILQSEDGFTFKDSVLFEFIRESLRTAIFASSTQAVRLFLLLYISCAAIRNEKDLSLGSAICRLGTEEMVRQLFNYFPREKKLLDIAVCSGNVTAVKVFLEDPEVIMAINQNYEGNEFHPLHRAARFNQFEIVKLLVDKGAKTEGTLLQKFRNSNYSFSLLDHALVGGNPDIYTFFENRNIKHAYPIPNLMGLAAIKGQLWFFEKLTKEGVNVGSITEIKAKIDQSEEFNADYLKFIRERLDALISGIENSHFEVVQYLVNHGMEVLHLDETLQLNLADAKDELFLTNYCQISPLQKAAAQKNPKILPFLFSKIKKMNSREKQIVMKAAIETGCLDNIDFLLKHGFELTHADVRTAVKTRGLNVVKLLLKYIDVNQKDDQTGNTLLHHAVTPSKEECSSFQQDGTKRRQMVGHAAIIAYLLCRGAKVQVRNNEGKTPLQMLSSFVKVYPIQLAVEVLLAEGANSKELPQTYKRFQATRDIALNLLAKFSSERVEAGTKEKSEANNPILGKRKRDEGDEKREDKDPSLG
jgi:ankyrin repeat protein